MCLVGISGELGAKGIRKGLVHFSEGLGNVS